MRNINQICSQIIKTRPFSWDIIAGLKEDVKLYLQSNIWSSGGTSGAPILGLWMVQVDEHGYINIMSTQSNFPHHSLHKVSCYLYLFSSKGWVEEP